VHNKNTIMINITFQVHINNQAKFDFETPKVLFLHKSTIATCTYLSK